MRTRVFDFALVVLGALLMILGAVQLLASIVAAELNPRDLASLASAFVALLPGAVFFSFGARRLNEHSTNEAESDGKLPSAQPIASPAASAAIIPFPQSIVTLETTSSRSEIYRR